MLSLRLALSRRACWNAAEKQMLLIQKLRVKGREAAALGGDEGPN